MTGKYDIEIYNNRVHYYLQVKRNITILQGNSATGKTELIRLISDLEENGSSSGITLKCDVKCTVLTSVDWELRLESLSGCIIFIDETASFLKTRRFAELVRGSDNYFVIITRDDLDQLPYSVEEIYGLRNAEGSSKYNRFKKVYNEMYGLYNLDIGEPFKPEAVITEDSNSGYEFFSEIFPNICDSAGGKSKVYNSARANKKNDVLIIVDGAAFGSEMGRIYRYLMFSQRHIVIYAPESFEYLLLKSGVVDAPSSVTEKTFAHADSKSKLNDIYKTDSVVKRVKAIMPESVFCVR